MAGGGGAGGFGRAAAVVCVSEFTRAQMHAAGIRPKQERAIPNGADPERFRCLPKTNSPAIRRELGLPQGVPLIVTVGNVTERKGQDIVVRALAETSEPAHYAIVGMPTRGVEIASLAAELGVADRVHLLGRLDGGRLVRLLNAADIFVMTSRHTRDATSRATVSPSSRRRSAASRRLWREAQALPKP